MSLLFISPEGKADYSAVDLPFSLSVFFFCPISAIIKIEFKGEMFFTQLRFMDFPSPPVYAFYLPSTSSISES